MQTISVNAPASTRSSPDEKRHAAWLRLVAMLLVVGMSLGASCHGPAIEVIECPETPDELFDVPLPDEWEDWYLETYDPWCEGLREAGG